MKSASKEHQKRIKSASKMHQRCIKSAFTYISKFTNVSKFLVTFVKKIRKFPLVNPKICLNFRAPKFTSFGDSGFNTIPPSPNMFNLFNEFTTTTYAFAGNAPKPKLPQSKRVCLRPQRSQSGSDLGKNLVLCHAGRRRPHWT